jgi:hypothetical protein
MPPPQNSVPASGPDSLTPFVEVRYPLPALLRDVQRDRASSAFAMEKLDQAAITMLFEQQRVRRDANPGK